MSEKLQFGFNFRGIEEVFENKVIQSIHERTTPVFRYVEIGIAEGKTLKSVANICRRDGPHDWQCVGIDLVNSEYFNPKPFLMGTLAFNTSIEFEGQCNREPFIADRITYEVRILLLKGAEKRVQSSPNCINFCLIDACHGAPCVEKDFLSIEKGMATGGIVAFHDAGLADQGQGYQPHCQQPIGVLDALVSLKLSQNVEMPPFTCRPGWKWIGQCDGDKSPGNPCDNGNGIIFFQKL